MPEFCSFLVFRADEIELIHSICAAANWSTRDIHDPSKRYAFFERGMRELSQASASKDIGIRRGGQEGGRLLLLESKKTEADNIIQLVCAANVILEGFQFVKNRPTCGFELSDDEADRQVTFKNVFRSDGFFQWFTYRQMLPVAVAIAAEAWRDKKLVYAIHKLASSYDTECVTPWSMHPRYGQAFEKHSDSFASHVRTSIAINLAYSAIEELDLGVKASGEVPRSIGKGTFVWNPKVLEPFKERLRNAGIDLERTIDWVTRGDKSEISLYEMFNQPSEYSNGVDVRDRQVSVPDAVNFSEFLRSKMTAHAFSSETHRLGPYEVYNVQQVARFLILSKCNLWNTCTEELRKRYH
ncbi:hypothetical protein E4L95_08760 [Paracoccus liaowanqingii]|uniref:Uncharacterized protein n=1 Tax=Paracoccus liaowanqingii TaxID=2560053 RepID=A0A4Z1CBA3_9RHOB|nr:hypothetical protein [Paracoccus liaowanqingii]TGN61872.1 hypothetical protein E4L95_08760 [Paracoccus liaowanqingii]